METKKKQFKMPHTFVIIGIIILLGAVAEPQATALRRHLAAWYDAVLLPRHWRFVPTLPYDERGKLPQPALAGLFERSDRS